MTAEPVDTLTADSLFSGRVTCLQHRHGYRFSVDAVLLAHFIGPAAGDRILDLGAGCGVVSIILGFRYPDITLTALEVQPALAELCRRNAASNGLALRLRVVEGDLVNISGLLALGSHDWVVANPPYRKAATGRRNQGPEQAICRHEIKADLAAVVRAAALALKTRGRAAFVYPAARAAALLAELLHHALAPKRLRVVHNHPGSAGKLVLVEAVKAGGEQLSILPPLFIRKSPGGGHSPEMARFYEP